MRLVKMSEKRTGNISSGQRTILIEFLNKHPELVSAKFSSTFSFKDGQKLWCEVTNILNALPGAKKTWEQWRKTWHDMKTKVKGKKADINRSLRKTGGGPPSDINLTETDNNIAELIGPTTIYGDAAVEESIAEFDFQNSENNESRSTTGFKENIPDVLKTVPTNNNILKNIICKKNIDLITKKYIPQNSSVNCNKENDSSIFEKVVEHYDFIPEPVNEDINANSSIQIQNNPNTGPIIRTAKISSIMKSRRNASQRVTKQGCFENTLSYTKCLSTNMENEVKIREEYYNKKLKLMERDVIAKERIAAAIETFCAITNQENITYEEVENLEDTNY